MKNSVLCFALLLPVAAGAATDDKLQTQAATVELMRSVFPPDAYNATLDQMYDQMAAGMRQMGNPELTPEKQKALKAAVRECLPYEDLLKWTGEVYARHFTKKEIEDLAAFYRTPTGAKVAKTIPALGGEMGKKMAPLLMQRLPIALKKHGLQ